jgi:hypothetical protein
MKNKSDIVLRHRPGAECIGIAVVLIACAVGTAFVSRVLCAVVCVFLAIHLISIALMFSNSVVISKDSITQTTGILFFKKTRTIYLDKQCEVQVSRTSTGLQNVEIFSGNAIRSMRIPGMTTEQIKIIRDRIRDASQQV